MLNEYTYNLSSQVNADKLSVGGRTATGTHKLVKGRHGARGQRVGNPCFKVWRNYRKLG